jgi:hypothetical protein
MYLKTVKQLYDECLEERMQFRSEHRYDGEKHKLSRTNVTQRAKLIYQREKTAAIAGQDPNIEKQIS